MVAIAILSVDPTLRARLEQLPSRDSGISIAGIVDSASALFELTEQHRVDVVVADAAIAEGLADWGVRRERTALVAIESRANEDSELDALGAGASALLPRSASCEAFSAAIRAAASDFVIVRRQRLLALLDAEAPAGRRTRSEDFQDQLTPRELEVLAAMADGLTNKAIARRLAISFHTVKFHVAAILEKLGAESRTEAVMKAAQRGLVML